MLHSMPRANHGNQFHHAIGVGEGILPLKVRLEGSLTYRGPRVRSIEAYQLLVGISLRLRFESESQSEVVARAYFPMWLVSATMH